MQSRIALALGLCACVGGGARAQDAAPPEAAAPRVRSLCDTGTAHAAWDGGLFWLARNTGEVLQIDATTTEVRARLRVDGTPQHVAVGAHWVFVTCRRLQPRGQVGPRDVVHVIARDGDVALERSIECDAPVGVAAIGNDRIAIVGRQILVAKPSTGAVEATLPAGEGTVNGFDHDATRLCVTKQRPGRLAVFDLSGPALRWDQAGYKWITGVRIVGDRALVTLMMPEPGFGAFDLATGAFTRFDDDGAARLLPEYADAAGQRWAIRAAKGSYALDVVRVDAEGLATDPIAVPDVRSQWPRLLHVDEGRFVFHTLREGVFSLAR